MLLGVASTCRYARLPAKQDVSLNHRHAKCHRNKRSNCAARDSNQSANSREPLDRQSSSQEAKATDFIDTDSLQTSSSVYASAQSEAYQNVTPSLQQQQKQGNLDPNFWAQKPYWCQPWSILLTGTLFVAGAKQLFHNPVITGLAAIPILVWWYLFLILVPANYRSFVEEE